MIRLPPAPGPAPASPRPSSRRQRTVLPPLPPRSPAPSGSLTRKVVKFVDNRTRSAYVVNSPGGTGARQEPKK